MSCSVTLKATYNGAQYTSLRSAINAAGKSSGGTVTAQALLAESITITADVTIDLNGKNWVVEYPTPSVPLTVNGGNVTLKGGVLRGGYASALGNGIIINGGSLTLAEGFVAQGTDATAVRVNGGDLVLNKNVALLTGMKVPVGKVLVDYLPEGTAFVKCSEDPSGVITVSDPQAFVAGVYEQNETTESMAVVAHTHAGSPCACGYVCSHESGWTEGGKCKGCGASAAAKVTARQARPIICLSPPR